MKISDRVLELTTLNQTTKQALTNHYGDPLGIDICKDMEDVRYRDIPPLTSEQIQSMLALFQESYNPKYWDKFVFHRHMEANLDEEGRCLVSMMDEDGAIPVDQRNGLLDLKFKAISDHTSGPTQWSAWALMALQNTYGYAPDGYSVLLSRLSILQDFIDHYEYKFGACDDSYLIEQAVHILTWNIFQFNETKDDPDQIRIMDWTSKMPISLLSAFKGEAYGL